MPRGKQGNKAGRKERNRDFQNGLKRRKRDRKARAAQFAHLPGQQAAREHLGDAHGGTAIILHPEEARAAQIAVLDKETAVELRRRCKAQSLPLRSRDKKMDAILLLMGEHPRQVGMKLVEPS